MLTILRVHINLKRLARMCHRLMMWLCIFSRGTKSTYFNITVTSMLVNLPLFQLDRQCHGLHNRRKGWLLMKWRYVKLCPWLHYFHLSALYFWLVHMGQTHRRWFSRLNLFSVLNFSFWIQEKSFMWTCFKMSCLTLLCYSKFMSCNWLDSANNHLSDKR